MIFITLIPVLILVLLLAVFRIKASIAAAAALLSACLISMIIFSTPAYLVFFSILEGALMALWPILLVITASIFAYNFTCKTGAMETIKQIMLSISPEKSVQTLILAWGFGGFMEGIAGYGTAVAIPAGIMASIGFNPFSAALICLTANTVSTAFGAVGIPAVTLSLMTSLDPGILTSVIAMQLLPMTLVLPFVLVIMTEKSITKAFKFMPEILAASLSFTAVFTASAFYLGPQFPTILGSMASIAAVGAVTSRRKQGGGSAAENGAASAPASAVPAERPGLRESIKALTVYIFILLLIILASPVFPGIKEALDQFKSSFQIYPGSGGKTITFYWLSTPGVLIALAVFITAGFYRKSVRFTMAVLFSTARQLADAALTITALVAAAAVMRYSGMTDYLASSAAAAAGTMFPLYSPLIGAAGTFLTGSDTSSCILFGEIQKNIGLQLGLDKFWLPAANMAGATAGKMIAPQSVAVAAAAVGIKGEEGRLLRTLIGGCLVYAAVLGLIVLLFAGSAGRIAEFAARFAG